MNLQDAIAAYRAAQSEGDDAACERILDAVDPELIEQVISAAEPEVDEQSSEPELATDRLAESLTRAGLGRDLASQLSALTAGSFADYVRARMESLGMTPDTVYERAVEEGEDVQEEDRLLIESWIASIVEERVAPAELPADAVVAIARALGAQQQTLASLIDRHATA